MYFEVLEEQEQEQLKSRASTKKGIIKIRTEINEIEVKMQKNHQWIEELVLWKINENRQLLA